MIERSRSARTIVGALLLVSPGLLDGVAGVDMVEKLDPLYHAPAVDVETGNDSLREHSVKSRKDDGRRID